MKMIFVNDENSVWQDAFTDKYKSIEGVDEILQVKPEEIATYLNDEKPEESDAKAIGFFNDGMLYYREVGAKFMCRYKEEDSKFEEVKPEDLEIPEEEKEEKFTFIRTFILKKGSRNVGMELLGAPTTMKQYYKLSGSNGDTNKMMLFERESKDGQIKRSMIGFVDDKGETTYTEINSHFFYAIMTEENFGDSYLVQYKSVIKKDEENQRWIVFKFDDLNVIKVYFNTEEDKNAFEVPEDFLIDISDDDRFKPHSLAMNPYKNWKEDFYKENNITDDEMHYTKEEQEEINKEMLGPLAGLSALFGGGNQEMDPSIMGNMFGDGIQIAPDGQIILPGQDGQQPQIIEEQPSSGVVITKEKMEENFKKMEETKNESESVDGN